MTSGWSDRRLELEADDHDHDSNPGRSLGGFLKADDARNATRFNIMKPFRFDGVSSHAHSGLTEAGVASIDPVPGTLLLFPSWLSHSADLHVGDETRISIAFNVKTKLGRQQENDKQSPAFGNGMPDPTELTVKIPERHCTPGLCKGRGIIYT